MTTLPQTIPPTIPIGSPLLYTLFAFIVGIMILIDMLALKHTGEHKVSFKEALIWTIIWVAVSLIFNLGLWWYLSFHLPESLHVTGNHQAFANRVSLEFLSGYVLEKSLSMDNIFIFLLIFKFFKVPSIYERQVLVYGVLAAIFLRILMILLGSYLLERFEWILYLFGAFLLYSGIKMLFPQNEDEDLSHNLLVRLAKRLFRFTDKFEGGHFFTSIDGIRYATPLLLVLIVITISDIIFAVDSVPAVFAVSRDPFIVMTSNIFALLGLRAMYFLLADMADRFYLLHYGLALILIFIGSKMLLLYFAVDIPILLSLTTILGLLFLSIVGSLFIKPIPKKNK